MKKGEKMTIESKKKLSETQKMKYKNGYVNPMKGKKRPDLSEYNRKYKSDQLKGITVSTETIRKRKETIERRGGTKKVFGDRCGENNANYRGGISNGEYGLEFNRELKLAVKIRDKFRCKICHKEEKDTSQGLHIHHIDYNKKNNSLKNLITLCGNCHVRTNGNRRRWIKYFKRDELTQLEFLDWNEINFCISKICKFLKNKKISGVVPILRGGACPALMVSQHLNIPLKIKVDCDDDILIDDIVDFGITMKRYKRKYPKNIFVALHLNSKNFKLKQNKPNFYVKKVENFIVYPWEKDIESWETLGIHPKKVEYIKNKNGGKNK